MPKHKSKHATHHKPQPKENWLHRHRLLIATLIVVFAVSFFFPVDWKARAGEVLVTSFLDCLGERTLL